MPDTDTPTFAPYTVAGVGTVVAHESNTYVVLATNGSTYGYVSPSGEPSEEISAEEIAYAIAHPPQFPPNAVTIYEGKLAEGWTDPVTGLKLKTLRSSKANFSDMLGLVNLGIEQGAMTSETPVTIFDYTDTERALTVEAFKALILRYGLHWKAVFDEFAP